MTNVREAVQGVTDGVDSPLVPVALRLAGLLDAADLSARDASAVSRELRQVLTELDDVGTVDADDIDQLAARRAARISDATG